MAIEKTRPAPAARKSEAGTTMEDLAQLAGVSTITVSRALRNSPLVTEKTREKVRRIAQQQGYRLNLSARNLRMGRSHSVAVVVEMAPAKGRPMSDPYPLALLGGLTEELTAAGYTVVLASRQLLDSAPVRGADGLILLNQESPGEAVSILQEAGLPLVAWGAPHASASCVVVGSDDRAGGAAAAARFIEQARRKLVFLGDVGHAEVQATCAGFSEAMRGKGAVHIVRPEASSFEAGFDSMSRLLKKTGPAAMDGVFAASDWLAMGALRALAEHGLRVPDQVCVIGYGDTPGAASFIPPLTSVHQDVWAGGILLGRKMLALLGDEPAASEVLPTRLVVRQT